MPDIWMIYAASGEYSVEGRNLLDAYFVWAAKHPDDFVFAVVSNEMRPPLVPNMDWQE